MSRKINKVPCVYQIISKSTNQIYIGGCEDFVGRIACHLWYLRKNIHANYLIQECFDKYGIDDLVFEIIEEVNGGKKERKIREQYYIDTLNPELNICRHSYSTKGRVTSEIVKQKLRIAHKGYKPCELARINSLKKTAKLVLNLETGIYYDSIKEAAKAHNIEKSRLVKMISNVIRNKTDLVLAHIGYKVEYIKKISPDYIRVAHNCINVINLETGIFYNCIKDAAIAHNINTGSLRSMLNPKARIKNKTSLIYA